MRLVMEDKRSGEIIGIQGKNIKFYDSMA
jgi:hypothetical protein